MSPLQTEIVRGMREVRRFRQSSSPYAVLRTALSYIGAHQKGQHRLNSGLRLRRADDSATDFWLDKRLMLCSATLFRFSFSIYAEEHTRPWSQSRLAIIPEVFLYTLWYQKEGGALFSFGRHLRGCLQSALGRGGAAFPCCVKSR
jgi:hypothetical protein